jgi:hypothetical protein
VVKELPQHVIVYSESRIYKVNFTMFINIKAIKNSCVLTSGVTLYQGALGSKFSKGPLVEVPKARVERRICTSFLRGPGHAHPENF